jgi:hypothetical protein
MTAADRSDGGDPVAAMVDDDGVVEIDPPVLRRAYEAGATLNDLARQLGISNQVVRAFIVAAGGHIRQPFGGQRRQRIRVVGATGPEQIAVIAAAVAGAAEVERDADWDGLR